MDTSVFMDLNKMPQTADLKSPPGKTFDQWMEIRDFVFVKYPKAVEEWKVWIKKYGWGFRIKDKKGRSFTFLPVKDFSALQ